MTVTEFAKFKVLPPFTCSSPEILEFLVDVGKKQHAFSGYPLRFYQDVNSPDVVYLVSGWDTVEDHGRWSATDASRKVIERCMLEKLVAIEGLAHLEVEFPSLPGEWKGIAHVVVEKEGNPVADANGEHFVVCNDSSTKRCLVEGSFKNATHQTFVARDQTSPCGEVFQLAVLKDDVTGLEGKWDGVANFLAVN